MGPKKEQYAVFFMETGLSTWWYHSCDNNKAGAERTALELVRSGRKITHIKLVQILEEGIPYVPDPSPIQWK